MSDIVSVKRHHKIVREYPEIVEIKPFYWIENRDKSIKYYSVLSEIANEYETSVVNIKRQIDGDYVGKLNGVTINKEKFPYVITFKDTIHDCRTLSDIKRITGVSVSKIHSLIKEFVLR